MKNIELDFREIDKYRKQISNRILDIRDEIVNQLPIELKQYTKQIIAENESNIVLTYNTKVNIERIGLAIPFKFIVKLHEYLPERKKIQEYFDEYTITANWNN